jgi:uncharacterized protein YxjI
MLIKPLLKNAPTKMQKYPLTLTFKFWTLAPKIELADRAGNPVLFVRQKLFRLKEVIQVFSDATQSRQLYTIKADRIIDFSARYNFSDAQGQSLGAVKRKGMRSLWKAHYDILEREGGQNAQSTFFIQEDDPWIKVLDAVFSEIPILGMFSGMVLNPTFSVKRANGELVMRLEKVPSFWSRIFTIKQLNPLTSEEETQILLSLLMLILLERSRG